MRINELKIEQIVVGLKIKSLVNPKRIGEIIRIDKDDDYYCWILWPGDDRSYGGFYGNHCECEVAE